MDPVSLKRKVDELCTQRDELRATVQAQDKLISSLGLDDSDKVKSIKRVLASADKEGGLDELERRMALFNPYRTRTQTSLSPYKGYCTRW